ncbi:MAG: hypothetical protein AAF298_19610 [Cyanobacteria bacterium P01_A01_bin.40]
MKDDRFFFFILLKSKKKIANNLQFNKYKIRLTIISTENYSLAMTSLIERYDHPLVRALMQLVPMGIGSSLDVALTETISRIRRERQIAFFDQIAKSTIALKEEDIQSDDFIYGFFAVYKHINNTRYIEKVKLFANLFINGVLTKHIYEHDLFVDYVDILEKLNIRDIFVLKEIENFEQLYTKGELKPKHQDIAQPSDIIPHWHTEFMQPIQQKLNIDDAGFKRILLKLIGVGLFERTYFLNTNSTATTVGNYDLTGILTPTYEEFKRLVLLDNQSSN